METFVLILCCLCLLFFVVVGMASMFVHRSTCHLIELYDGGRGNIFGITSSKKLVMVSGNLPSFNVPYSADDVAEKSADMDYVELKIVIGSVKPMVNGSLRAAVVLRGKNYTLLECRDDKAAPFLAVSKTRQLDKYLSKNKELFVESSSLVSIRELVIQ